ncbi:asparagine synthase-related protein [Paracoccus sp. (in: a-proteobacteria)]|uniref:asparagine synthase-related protein n=1 Tax=Paracoccus sp. TaxID=267 RepID=UPI00396CEC10
MTRFAALAGANAGDTLRAAAEAMAADLARRTQLRPELAARETGWLMRTAIANLSAGSAGIHILGPLSLCGDLGLTDLAALRAVAGGTARDMPEQLLLALWLRLGEGALSHLNGAFAFVLHDARSGALWVVRDRFGIRPVAYAVTDDRCVVASDISTVLAGLETVPEVDRQWIADFLSGQGTSHEMTAYAAVRRLPPGHWLRVDTRGQAVCRRWYDLTDAADPAPHDAAEALQAMLKHATTQACLGGQTATALSGGLDSSSLALLSVQPGQARPALSLRYDNLSMDEGAYIQAVLTQANGALEPVMMRGEADDSMFDLDPLLDEQDQPVFAPGLSGNRQLYRKVRDLGCQGLLDGHGGDEVIGGTLSNIANIAAEGRWPLAFRLARQHAAFVGEPRLQMMAQLLAWQGRRGFGRLGRLLASAPARDAVSWRALVDPQLAEQTDLVARVRALHAGEKGRPTLPAGVRAHMALLSSPLIGSAFEVMDRAARANGVTPHYPFYDHRVAELCVWQSDEAKIAQGRPRNLLRQAMQGVLPEMVRLRRDKADFIADFWSALRRDPSGRLAAYRRGPGVLEGWVDPAILRKDVEAIATSNHSNTQIAFRVWRAVWLAAWLERPTPQVQPASFPEDLIITDCA